jgi:hypothetical protein
MLFVARLTEILTSTYFATGKMPLLKDMIMREGINEDELHISTMMCDNMLRLGTTHTKRSAETLEDITTPQEIKSVEKVHIDIMKNNHVNVFASDEGGAKPGFRPVTADDWKEGATGPRAYIKATSEACPAAISLFVSMGCIDVGDRRRKGHTVFTPSYIVQPNVNVRDLSSGGRLDDRTGQIATALGKTQFDLSSHDMEACLYSVVVEDDDSAVGNREEHARLHPMVSTGFQPGTGLETLCGSPRAMAAAVCDVDALWLALFGQVRGDCVEVNGDLNDVERATVIFSALISRLVTDYNGFMTYSDWMRLHRRLREFMWEGIELHYRHTNENELYHEVKVMLQAITPLRIALLDGLGRIGGTVYSLLGRLPERDPAEVRMRLRDNKRIIKFDREIYKKTGAATTLSLVCFDNNGSKERKSWTKEEVGRYQDYSAWLQDTYLVVTQRSIQDCMYDISRKLGADHIAGNRVCEPYTYLRPGEFEDDSSVKDLNAAWLAVLRLDVMNRIREDKSPQVKELLKQLEKERDYEINPTRWEEDKLGEKQGAIMDRKDMEKPKKIMTMITLLTQFQFGNKKNTADLKSLSELQKFIRWNGKGVYNAGGEDDEGQDDTPLGLPPHPDSDTMMGLLPTSTDRTVNAFDDMFTWLVHRPQVLLGHSMAKKLLSDGIYQQGRLSNLQPRYIIPAGSALLSLYNQVGPILDMSDEVREVMPNMHALLETNPYEDQSTWDGVADYNRPGWFAELKPPGNTTKMWSNIPTFVCIVNWIAMRSDFDEVPDGEKLFHYHRVPTMKYFNDKGNLMFNGEDNVVGGDKTAVVTGWAEAFSPKFVFKKQRFKKEKTEKTNVPGATLLEMVDLLLNEKSQLWPKFLMKKDVDPTTKKALRQKIDELCGYFDWKNHYFDGMGDIKRYTQLTSKNRPPPKVDRTKVLLGYVDVASSDETGKVVTTRMSVRAHKLDQSTELAAQKKKKKDDREKAPRIDESSEPKDALYDNGDDNQFTGDNGTGDGDDNERQEGNTEGCQEGEGQQQQGRGHRPTTSTSTSTNTNANAHANAEAKAKAEAEADAHANAEAEADAHAKADADADTDTDAHADTDTNANTNNATGHAAMRTEETALKVGAETEEEPIERLRYSQNYLAKMEMAYMERELEDKTKDPSAMLFELGKQCVERAGRFFLNSEFAGRFMAQKREEHEVFWRDIEFEDYDGVKEKAWLKQFSTDKKAMVEMMWKEGDRQLAARKDAGSSLMGPDFGDSLGDIIKGHADGYATWVEREVSKKQDPSLNTAVGASAKEMQEHAEEEQGGLGTVSYFTRCIQTAVLRGADMKDGDIDEAKHEMAEKLDGREADWRDKQYQPLENACVKTLENGSPQKSQMESPQADWRDKQYQPLENACDKTLENEAPQKSQMESPQRSPKKSGKRKTSASRTSSARSSGKRKTSASRTSSARSSKKEKSRSACTFDQEGE